MLTKNGVVFQLLRTRLSTPRRIGSQPRHARRWYRWAVGGPDALAGGAPRARHVAFEARRCGRRALVRLGQGAIRRVFGGEGHTARLDVFFVDKKQNYFV